MEELYFGIVNVLLFAIVIGLIWMIGEAILPDGHNTFEERLGESASQHLPMLGGLAVLIVGSYFVYRQFYPDTYECRLTDGRTVNAEFDATRAWIKVGEDSVPMSTVEECRPLVVTLSQRIERAFGKEVD